MNKIEKKLTIDVPELAKLLGISKPTAYELIKREGFPAVRVSARRTVIPLEALNRWLNDPVNQGCARV